MNHPIRTGLVLTVAIFVAGLTAQLPGAIAPFTVALVANLIMLGAMARVLPAWLAFWSILVAFLGLVGYRDGNAGAGLALGIVICYGGWRLFPSPAPSRGGK